MQNRYVARRQRNKADVPEERCPFCNNYILICDDCGLIIREDDEAAYFRTKDGVGRYFHKECYRFLNELKAQERVRLQARVGKAVTGEAFKSIENSDLVEQARLNDATNTITFIWGNLKKLSATGLSMYNANYRNLVDQFLITDAGKLLGEDKILEICGLHRDKYSKIPLDEKEHSGF